MGLLEKLWDDTLAGPHPDSGLGKLRKFNTFSPRSAKDNEGMSGRSEGEEAAAAAAAAEGVKVTRSIMIMKPPGYQHTAGSAPSSPAGSTPPVSPFSGEATDWNNHVLGREGREIEKLQRNIGEGNLSVECGSGFIKPECLVESNRSGAFRFRRRSTSDANEKATNEDGASGSTPPP